jgi:CRISPR system Cascade subunit CasB
MAPENKASSKEEAFVQTVIEKLKGADTAFGAALRRADNPATEYQCWEFLCQGRNQNQWCDITKNRECKPYALIGAALARAKPDKDGNLSIGRAIARCYSDAGSLNDQDHPAAKAKFRRLLACNTAEEACRILRPLLGLINSWGIALNYTGLLRDLLFSRETFNERVKPRWAMDFYRKKEEE